MVRTITEKIRAWMKKTGTKQKWLAKEADMDPGQLSNCLAGRRAFKVDELITIESITGITVFDKSLK